MEFKLVIEGTLPSLNEYIDAERSQRHAAARMKREAQELVCWYIRAQLGSQAASKPVRMHYLWVVPSRRKDRDNVAFARKFIQDALVQMGFLKNDGWQHILGWSDDFDVDADRPRIEVTITEVEEDEHGETDSKPRRYVRRKDQGA